MLNFIRSMFRKPTALQIASRDLEDARRNCLAAMQHAEYYAALAQYNDGMIERLSIYVSEAAHEAG